jgi:hypothetical protein
MERYPSDSEVWKPIPGYEWLYEASSLGNIRTAEGKTTSSARFDNRVWQQRVMKQKREKRHGNAGNVDARICLWKDGEEKTFLVSRLIAMAFLPTPYECLTVNHIDGNPSNNHVENLEWVTRADNIKLGFEKGQYASIQKAVVLQSGDGAERRFRSMAEASRYLGRGNGYVSDAIAKCLYCYDTNGTKYSARLSEERDTAL